mmetsp:Transcript_13567/g.39116  ORF Transcript_13567/g.39116 Transcript_13567/m.39116 type:complete len:179 (+) Transcript_13567:994-1530(+)
MFSDEFFLLSNVSNSQFCGQLAAWTCHQTGVLRSINLRHHKYDEESAPYMYRIMDNITFSIDIQEIKQGKWVAYMGDDVQVEFVMLDPYLRLFLDNKASSGTFTTNFKAPDHWGVFKFVIDHRRQGYTFLHIEEQAPLRNFKHDDYARFIWCAFPYYGSVFSTIAAVVGFSFIFLSSA